MISALFLLCLAASTQLSTSARLDHIRRRGFQNHHIFRNPHHTLAPRAPRFDFREPRGVFIPILRMNQYGPINGHYNFDFETGNGILREERGEPTGPNGAVVSQGSWSFTLPDGTPAEFTFVADERGYQPRSALIPVPPPMPAHALEQIRKAERERAQGIFHDGQYDPRRYQ